MAYGAAPLRGFSSSRSTMFQGRNQNPERVPTSGSLTMRMGTGRACRNSAHSRPSPRPGPPSVTDRNSPPKEAIEDALLISRQIRPANRRIQKLSSPARARTNCHRRDGSPAGPDESKLTGVRARGKREHDPANRRVWNLEGIATSIVELPARSDPQSPITRGRSAVDSCRNSTPSRCVEPVIAKRSASWRGRSSIAPTPDPI